MSEVFTTERRVEFCETDAAGIVHFSSYVRYMEQAEHELWRSFGGSVMQSLDDGAHLGWPRVRVECDYQGVAKFEDVLAISVCVLRLGEKSATFGFEFENHGRRIAKGKLVTVCCRVQHGQDLESIAIPAQARENLERYLVVSE